MENHGNTFDQVRPSRWDMEFYLFIVRCWDHPAKPYQNESQTIEFVAEDSKGQRIHIGVPKGLARRWRPLLKEFEMYKIANVVAVDPRMRKNLKTIPCSRYLTFSHRTTVTHIENPIFPIHPFRFRTIPELLDEYEVFPSHTFDFIGEVVGKEDPRDVTIQNTGKEIKRLVIVHFNLFSGKTSLQSNFDLSKIHINADLKDVNEFKEKLLEAGPTLSGRISQVNSDGNKHGVEELIKGEASVKTIDDLPLMTKECEIWICGSIVALNVGSNDWFYTACAGAKCAKKVSWSGVGEFKCPFCNKNTGCPTTRYKVEVMACDSTGCITLLLWEREVKMLCGKSSEKLKGEVVEGDNDYPPSLNKLLEKKLLIRIHVRNSNIIDSDPVYPVIKIVDDEQLIEKFNPSHCVLADQQVVHSYN